MVSSAGQILSSSQFVFSAMRRSIVQGKKPFFYLLLFVFVDSALWLWYLSTTVADSTGFSNTLLGTVLELN